jgi:hypothetical protein
MGLLYENTIEHMQKKIRQSGKKYTKTRKLSHQHFKILRIITGILEFLVQPSRSCLHKQV